MDRDVRRGQEILSSVFGYEEFRPGQQEVVAHVISGSDAFVLMPTGGGKSYCYQIPGLAREGMCVVVSPLVSLMIDQVGTLLSKGVSAAYVASDQSEEEQRVIARRIRAGDVQFLYVSPERMQVPRFISFLKSLTISCFAIDEAHCVSQWGHDFRAAYKGLGSVLGEFPHVPKIALTATADIPTRVDIVELLGLQSAKVFISGFDRKNIELIVEKVEEDIFQAAADFVAARPGQTGILYRTSRKKVDETVLELIRRGHNAVGYHAGMSSRERRSVQERFVQEDGILVVATIAFGMGIDRPDVRFVVHMDPPSTMEGYYQEIGRAGRDGEASVAALFFTAKQIAKVRQKIEMNDSVADDRKAVLRAKAEGIFAYLETPTCRRATLLRYFGESPSEACGSCDRCTNRPTVRNGYSLARTLAEAVIQTDERLGMKSISKILSPEAGARGLEEDSRRELRCYGSGASLPAKTWQTIARQLVGSGYFEIAAERFGALQLSKKGRLLILKQSFVPLIGDWYEIAPIVEQEDYTSLAEGQRGRVSESVREGMAKIRELLADDLLAGTVSERDLMRVFEVRPSSLSELSTLLSDEISMRSGPQVLKLLPKPAAEAIALDLGF